MVTDICDQLVRVSEMLNEPRTDQLTQMVQRDIEASLQELLEALAESKQQSGGGGGGGGGGDQPLLKKSAELKMLKARQVRINRQTRQLDRIRSESGGQPDPAIQTELNNAARQQETLVELAEEIGDGGQRP
jgi:hypothetical protein